MSLAAGSRAKRAPPMKTNPVLGIDIALRSFDVALWFDSVRCAKAQFPNDARGFRRLSRWLKPHGVGPVPAALESTNTYGEALASYLHAAGHRVYLLNPERVACFARTLGQRNKTDPADAVTIARFLVGRDDLTVWQPPSPEQQALRSLTRVRQQLTEQSVLLRNQLRTASELARRHLQAVLRAIASQLASLLREIRAHLQTHPTLGEQVRRLMTCKGIGLITAAVAIAELPPIDRHTDPRAISAWTGLTPRRWQSGRTELPARLSRKGNAYLRQALFMPALVAQRHNPLLRAFAQRLAANGKRPGAILGAVSHKLLRIIVGLLRSQTDFDPNWSPQHHQI
ncbi:MAG TPA: IS110 family transposase [Lacunisphaera sp.]|nr:IS110 family transposase [Lacunisphaera sp.]